MSAAVLCLAIKNSPLVSFGKRWAVRKSLLLPSLKSLGPQLDSVLMKCCQQNNLSLAPKSCHWTGFSPSHMKRDAAANWERVLSVWIWHWQQGLIHIFIHTGCLNSLLYMFECWIVVIIFLCLCVFFSPLLHVLQSSFITPDSVIMNATIVDVFVQIHHTFVNKSYLALQCYASYAK